MDGGFDPSDERLVSLSKDGNLDAFNSLVERYQSAVYSLCLRLLGSPPAAEDAAQEAFLSAFRAISRFSEGNVRNWLLRIAANECKDELRRQKRKDPGLSLNAMLDAEDGPHEIPDSGLSAPALLEQKELSEHIQRLLLVLPFDQRQAVVLSDLHGYHYEEIAEISGASIGTVKSRIHRARERLRRLIIADPELLPRAHR